MVSEPNFAQPAHRNFALPLILAVAILASAGAMLAYFFPSEKPQVTLAHSTVYVGKTVFEKQTFQNGSHVVGQGPSEEQDLYVVATVHIDNPLKTTIYLDDVNATLTGSDGSQMQASAIGKSDLSSVYNAFPELKPMVATPLVREASIAPGQSAEGTVLLQFPVTKDIWDARQSATLSVEFYHLAPITLTLPKP
jgi:hypothetical protein